MGKKQQHTPIGFSRHILHPSDAELTKQADILYPNDSVQQQAYVNGGVWMRNGYNEDRFLKQFDGQASVISELQQRIASLTDQVEQRWISVDERLPEINNIMGCGNKHSDCVLATNGEDTFVATIESVRPDFTTTVWVISYSDRDVKEYSGNDITHWQPLPPIPNNSPALTKKGE